MLLLAVKTYNVSIESHRLAYIFVISYISVSINLVINALEIYIPKIFPLHEHILLSWGSAGKVLIQIIIEI